MYMSVQTCSQMGRDDAECESLSLFGREFPGRCKHDDANDLVCL